MRVSSVAALFLAWSSCLAGTAWARPYEGTQDRIVWSTARSGAADRFKADKPRWRRDREVDISRIRLEIAPDLVQQTYEASVTHSFTVLAAELDHLDLDSKELDIRKVTDSKAKSLDFEVLPEKVVVHFSKPLKAGAQESIRLEYSGGSRYAGLHFFKADPRYPGQPDLAWSQGETDTNSYWIPMYDYPNQRASSEVIATVPQGMAAVSNGKLVSQGPGAKPGTTRFDWVEERPHVSYLIALYVGRLVPVKFQAKVQEGEHPREVPLTVWVAPGKEEEAKRTFAKTPAMVEYYSQLLDAPYPWDKYDQIVLYEFGGGMENTSATALSWRSLLDERAAIDNDADELISHELAHQWFGDLITCKDWSHIWLNEGFATFYQALWKAKDLGKDEFDYDMYCYAQGYFNETGNYQRPVVTDRYQESGDMFDAHTYSKGAWVLNMLRHEVGEERFARAMRRYVRERKDTVAETEDLRRAFEETTGKGFVEFFAQWLYGPGFPNLKLTPEWDLAEKKLRLHVTQKQVADGMPVFHFKLPIELVGRGGRMVTAEVSKADESFSWDLPARPKMIRVDPEMTVLAGYELDFPEDILLEQLRKDASVAGRVRAAKTLGKKADRAAVSALRDCVLKDPFWGVGATCARQLGEIGGAQALEALKDTVSVKPPKVRRAVAETLGTFLKQQEAFEALKPLAVSDESYNVEAAALASLGALRLPEARSILEAKLSKDSWREMIRGAALRGLGRLKDDALLPLLKEWSGPGKPVLARVAALSALAQTGEGKDDIRDLIVMILETEEDRYVRGAAIDALVTLGDPKAIGAISKIASRDPDHRHADGAINSIREGKKGKIEELSKQVDDVREKYDRLEKRFDDLEKNKKK